MDSPGRTPGRKPKISWSLRDTLRSLDGGPGYAGPPSDHFDGQVFFNPESRTRRSFGDFLKWQRTREPKPWPRWVVNRARPDPPASLAPGEIALTFINHITFLVQFAGLNILTDPVYSKRASPFRSVGPQRVREPGLAFEALPPIHVVLVTHNHYDHLDLPTLMRLEAVHAPHFITGLGNRAFLQQFGLHAVEELDWWQSASASGQSASPSGAQIIMTPAQHWSSRRPRNRNRTLWGGFVVQSAGRQLYFAGDTGYGGHFRQVRERLGRIDLALLPIGAYEPRWFMRDQHMNPDDAVLAHRDLEAATSVGTHFGCFQLTDEGIDEPVTDLAAARHSHGVTEEEFQVLDTGETRLFRW
ncbi:MAG TPA: MBL fold metallo-hydrolase [Steroidobacteraceae bacterium]|jgi:L-ascorbate metabolism protein UlaG (beta-lactamase superfamily)